jgi:hypothetical protein
MDFPNCKVKSVKADIANGQLTIVFRMKLIDENMDNAVALSLYADKDAGEVEVRVVPRQMPLKGLDPVPAETIDENDDGEE